MISPRRNPVNRALTWFGTLVLIMSFVIVLGDAGSAMASNISYVGSDGNLWRMSPDGQTKQRLTCGSPGRHGFVHGLRVLRAADRRQAD